MSSMIDQVSERLSEPPIRNSQKTRMSSEMDDNTRTLLSTHKTHMLIE